MDDVAQAECLDRETQLGGSIGNLVREWTPEMKARHEAEQRLHERVYEAEREAERAERETAARLQIKLAALEAALRIHQSTSSPKVVIQSASEIEAFLVGKA